MFLSGGGEIIRAQNGRIVDAGKLTISAWIKLSSGRQELGTIVSNRVSSCSLEADRSSQYGYALKVSKSGRLILTLGHSAFGCVVISSKIGVVVQETWTQVGFILDEGHDSGGSASIYANGEGVAHISGLANQRPLPKFRSHLNVFHVGSSSDGLEPLIGSVHDVQVYHGAFLTALRWASAKEPNMFGFVPPGLEPYLLLNYNFESHAHIERSVVEEKYEIKDMSQGDRDATYMNSEYVVKNSILLTDKAAEQHRRSALRALNNENDLINNSSGFIRVTKDPITQAPTPSVEKFSVTNTTPAENIIIVSNTTRKMAISLTITQDVTDTGAVGFVDGAAVLKHSIELTMTGKYEFHFIAMVHPGVIKARALLASIGYEIIEFEIPVKESEIRKEFLRKEIAKSGCCGIAELLKLCAFTLTQYDRVLVLDSDTLFLQPIDELFEVDKAIQFTYDHAMSSKVSKVPPTQGGFLLVTPSQAMFEEIVEIVREGDWRPQTGWGGMNIGWCYGGPTIQGLLAYYFEMVKPEAKSILDYCQYNAMSQDGVHGCKEVLPNEIKTFHFTECQKPWKCSGSGNEACKYMVNKWWEVRESLESKLGIEHGKRCKRTKKYPRIQFPNL